MRVIVAGSRDITNRKIVFDAVTISKLPVRRIVCGGARGVDALGKQYAYAYGLPCDVFRADWDTHRLRAGPMRNAEMAKHADALVLVWDGVSRGSHNMLAIAGHAGLWTFEVVVARNRSVERVSIWPEAYQEYLEQFYE